ncbi:MAG: hypothetical protein C0485_02240 [Pirellula sp.]|nr:hypothetical protein [Pirellula sp.]
MTLRPFAAVAFLALTCAVSIVFSAGFSIADEPEAKGAEAGDVIKKQDDAKQDDQANTAPSPAAPTYGSPIITRMRIGGRVEAKGGEVRDIFMMVAVPLDCTEQKVTVTEEEFPADLGTVEFRTLPDVKLAIPGAKQMLISIPKLPSRQTATSVVTYEIETKPVLAPTETATLHIPKKASRDLKGFLLASPFIDVNDREIKDAVEEALQLRVKDDETRKASAALGANGIGDPSQPPLSQPPVAEAKDEKKEKPPIKKAKKEKLSEAEEAALAAKIEKLTDWERVEALYDFVRVKVKYLNGAEDMPATKALEDGGADCYGMSALFVAMCRTMKVPARMVWVDNHQYAEFYLEEEDGKGYWYPAQLAGTRAFGEMPLPMVIFQKGDNFRVPERRRERLRYATDHTTLQASSKHKPRVVYVREPL